MLKLLLILFVLVAACVTIHGIGMVIGLRWLTRIWPRREHHFSLPFSVVNHLQIHFFRGAGESPHHPAP